jgi:phage shock protein E
MPQRRKHFLGMSLSIGLILLVVTACASTTVSAPAVPTVTASRPASLAPLPNTISVAETAAKREAGAFILDVRTQDEWNEYHVHGSTLIPLDQLETRLNEVPQDKDIIVVCRSGNRSQQGRDVLKAAGFKQVTSMSGGLNEWKAAGLSTATGP